MRFEDILLYKHLVRHSLISYNVKHSVNLSLINIIIIIMGDSYVRNMCGEEGVWWTPKTIGKIINKIDNLELKMQKMSTSEDRGCEPPYKPQVAPPRCRGGSQSRGTTKNFKPALSYSSRGNSGQRRNNNVRPQNVFHGSDSCGR